MVLEGRYSDASETRLISALREKMNISAGFPGYPEALKPRFAEMLILVAMVGHCQWQARL